MRLLSHSAKQDTHKKSAGAKSVLLRSGYLVTNRLLAIDPLLGSGNVPLYYLCFEGRVCDKALPATDLVLLLVRPSLSNDDAFFATVAEVCLTFFLVMMSTSSLITRS